ncbi:MAG: SagB/ThcOx family dehydrogenase [Anaerolineales bacterium]|nr:SagB/ThcOx family dehydrogenase [Anaerolineales bacterium]
MQIDLSSVKKSLIVFGVCAAAIVLVIILVMQSRQTQPAAIETEGSLFILPTPVHDSKTSVEKALLERRSLREYSREPLTLAEISQLLWAAQGITHPAGLRTAPSAGALYPLEIYLLAGNVTDLHAGIYRYKPESHALSLIAEGDQRPALRQAALGQSAVQDAAAIIVIAAIYERTTVKYGERGVSYVHMEVGSVAQNVYLQAVSLNLGTVFIGAFNDDEVKKVLHITGDEQPLGLMPVGRK